MSFEKLLTNLFISVVHRTDAHAYEVMLFLALAVNFCIKLNDIMHGFKQFLHLSDMAIRLDFLYLRTFDLLMISLFTG